MTPYAIGTDFPGGPGTHSYLPGGDWSNPAANNGLPQVDSFCFLEVSADLTNLGLPADYTVYVPCYFHVGK
jgi:hypothetical protein